MAITRCCRIWKCSASSSVVHLPRRRRSACTARLRARRGPVTAPAWVGSRACCSSWWCLPPTQRQPAARIALAAVRRACRRAGLQHPGGKHRRGPATPTGPRCRAAQHQLPPAACPHPPASWPGLRQCAGAIAGPAPLLAPGVDGLLGILAEQRVQVVVVHGAADEVAPVAVHRAVRADRLDAPPDLPRACAAAPGFRACLGQLAVLQEAVRPVGTPAQGECRAH